MVCGSGGLKSRFAKAAGAEPAGQTRDEKLHAVVARSTFPSQNVQNTPWSDHFWQLRCRKSARHCGAKHISKSKCTKHISLAPLLEVETTEKRTRLWSESHFEVKMYKTHQVRTTFGSWDVKKLHAVVARSTFRSQHVRSTPRSDTFGGSDAVSRGRRKGLCYENLWATDWGQNKRFFFYPFALDLDIFSLSSPDFSLILDILFLTFFKIIFLIIVFIMFFIRFLLFFILLAAKWIKIGFPRHKRPRAEEKCKILSLFCPFLPS